MQMRRLNEALIGLMTIGKMAELGRQLVLATDKKFADTTGQKSKVEGNTLQEWAPGYVAFDAVISITGVLSIMQGIRKNRKGAGLAGLVQGGNLLGYSVYYFLYSVIALRKAPPGVRLFNLALSLAHGAAGFRIFRFAMRARA